ncbi:MAG: hypothetical protein ACOYI5_10780, partial [Christensenellales bacterium]
AKRTKTRISEFPFGNSGEIRLHVPIRRRAGKLALGTNPFSPAKPIKMINHGGLRPSIPPGVHTFFVHAQDLIDARIVVFCPELW